MRPNGVVESRMDAGLLAPASGIMAGDWARSQASRTRCAETRCRPATANLNRSFDPAFARARLGELGIAAKKKSGKLSGGQQAQLALTLALRTSWPRS
jgi:ABC-2 type transport system ATP-binding protein